MIEKFGKTVFCTKAEAEKALEEMECRRVFLVTDPFFLKNGWAERVLKAAGAAEYEIFDNVTPDPSVTLAAEGAARVKDFRPELIIEKKTKRGLGQADIRPGIAQAVCTKAEGGISLRVRISAQEPTLNPENLIAALRQLKPELAPDFAKFTRLETYDAEGLMYR